MAVPVSLEAMSYALKVEAGSPIRKLVLLALADCHNGHTGRCDPRLGHLQRATELSERTVRRAMEHLVAEGLLERTRSRGVDGQLGGYDFVFPGLAVSVTAGPEVSVTASDFGSPCIEESHQRSERPLVPAVRVTAQDLELQGLEDQEPQEQLLSPLGPLSPLEIDCAVYETCPIKPPGIVNRKRVSQSEGHLSIRILQLFNEVFEAKPQFTASDWCGKIIMRLREHPEVTLEDHRLAMERAKADPWWTGAPSPSVVYGNAGLFEQRLAANYVQPNGGRTLIDAIRRRAEAQLDPDRR